MVAVGQLGVDKSKFLSQSRQVASGPWASLPFHCIELRARLRPANPPTRTSWK